MNKFKYPIIDWDAQLLVEGKVLALYPRTQRQCRLCGEYFIRMERHDAGTVDDIIGDDVCWACAKNDDIGNIRKLIKAGMFTESGEQLACHYLPLGHYLKEKNSK